MKFPAPIRQALYRTLPRQAFHSARYRWWYASSYVPRLVHSAFELRRPEAVYFGNSSALRRTLERVNRIAPTKLCRVMAKCGSDKSNSGHDYTTVYAALLAYREFELLRILEVGIGTNNPALVSTMGKQGIPGASLRGWRELFPKAQIFGADIDRSILFDDERIQTFYCDQLDPKAIERMWARPELREQMDVIVDDGLHTPEANECLLMNSLNHLRVGGYYVIEDVGDQWIPHWKSRLEGCAELFPNCGFALVSLPNLRNWMDNNLIVIHQRVSN